MPCVNLYWSIPPTENAACVARMEDVREVYTRPFDAAHPVVCRDETSKPLVGAVTEPLPPRSGQPARVEHAYVRHGTAAVFLEVEPLTGRVHGAARAPRTRRGTGRTGSGTCGRPGIQTQNGERG